MKIKMTASELATVLDICHSTSLTAPAFSPATSLYALFAGRGTVITNSGTCVSYLNSPVSVNEPFTIPIRAVRELISLTPSEISIQTGPDRVAIETDHSRAEFLTIPPEQYPYPELPSVPTSGFVNATRLALALERCVPVAQEAYEPRKVVYLFSLPGRGLWCLATDTYRVIVDNIADAEIDDIYQIIPVSSVNLIIRFCRASGSITVCSDKEKLVLASERGTVVVQSAQSLPLGLQELLEKIEQARLGNNQYSVSGLSTQCAVVHAIARQNRNIADFKVERSQSGDLSLVITSQTPEHFIRVSAPLSSTLSGGEEWSLNLQFLRSMLVAMQTDDIRLWIPGANSPIPAWIIAPANAEFPVGMLMPVVKR